MITRTISGKTPPTQFLFTLWALTAFFLLLTVFAVVAGWRLRKSSQRQVDPDRKGGQATQSGCLIAGGVPSLLIGVFLLVWAIQVT
ncbi:hypothetical protein V3G39_04395 [Dermatophilaceae bacterium Sec6.4]|nr:hypothetical protein [Actinomycetota bacterium]